MFPQRDPPLNYAEGARMDAMLSRFRSEYAITNREEIDGFFAALICSPDIAKPSEYLSEIWGAEMFYDEAFVDREQLMDFLALLMRHWDWVQAPFRQPDDQTDLTCAEQPAQDPLQARFDKIP